jgi:uncharacterized alpha-E superfamily protein
LLSRIARGLYGIGRDVERAQNVVRVLEVNHKMHLERAPVDRSNVWIAISEAFATGLAAPDEAALYDTLVLSASHPHSLRRCMRSARDQARAMRAHVSEEMWLHLNQWHLEFEPLDFAAVLSLGRSEFNRRIEVLADAFYGLADDTMIHGPAWHFLRIGRFVERAAMICRILDVKRKTLLQLPEAAGAPVDVHQWQALLRSLSGYEPYRRAYDARIVPARVLEFVLQRTDFPRSLTHALAQVADSLRALPGEHPASGDLLRSVSLLCDELRLLDPRTLLLAGVLEREVQLLARRCDELAAAVERSFFTSFRPALAPIRPVPHAGLVPQQ